MKKVLLIAACIFLAFNNVNAQSVSPPAIKKKPKVYNEHGTQRADDYFWMNDPTDSNVIAHLKAENKYVDGYMKSTEALQKKMYDELVERIPGRDESLPTKRKGYWYYVRYDEGQQYPYYARKKGTTTAQEEILLDVPAMAKGYQIYLVRGTANSPNSDYYIYGIDTTGGRRTTAYIKQLSTGKLLNESISNTTGNYAWNNDNNSFYYVLNDHTVRGYKVMRHKLGTDPGTDQEIFTEKDSTYRVSLSRTKSGRYIFINSTSTNTTEIRYLDANDPSASPVLIQSRVPGLEYRVYYFEGDLFHIYTNKDAKNFKYVSAPVNNPGMKNWKDVIPADNKAYLEYAEVLKNYIIAQTKENGLSQVRFLDRKTGKWSAVAPVFRS